MICNCIKPNIRQISSKHNILIAKLKGNTQRPTTDHLAHNINMATPKASKGQHKETLTKSKVNSNKHSAHKDTWQPSPWGEPSGTYVRALDYYATRHHLIDFAATTHGTIQNMLSTDTI